MKVLTIGIYGFSEENFFESLKREGVQVLCDIRQRRGLRGKKYSFANANKLQLRLKELGIKYIHLKELAPTLEIRNIQKRKDKEKGILKRERRELDKEFKESYRKNVLEKISFSEFSEMVGLKNNAIICLLCVEKLPTACHRSIVAEWIKENAPQVEIKHILP